MADNFQITQGSGTTIAATDVGGTMEQKVRPTTLPPDASTETTLALIKAKTDNLDVLLSTRTKPADTQIIREVDTTGRDLALQSKVTYSCTTAGFTPAATATDLFKITGSASKTIRIVDIRLNGTATAATTVDVFLIKRSTDDTAGTFVAGTVVSHDSNDPVASAVVGHYTANPTLGTAIGTISRKKVLLPISTTTAADPNISLIPNGALTMLDRPIVLRGTSQILAVNFNGAAIPTGGANWYVICVWT